MNIEKAYDLVLEKVILWLQDLIKLLPNILLAAIVLAIGIYISGRIRKITARLIRRVWYNATLNTLFVSVIYFAFIGITIFIVLSILELDTTVTSILAGAGIVGLALAFAFQDIAANFISGIFILFRRPMLVGDIVKIKDYMGKVHEINLRDTVVRTFQGQMVIIPNKDVFQNPIENFSLLGKRRVDLSIGVSYGDDLEKVARITLDAVKNLENISPDDETTLFYQEFGDSSINFLIRIWVNSTEQPEYLGVCSNAIISIKKAYDANDITIPFPIRTLDFGIKGGVTLNEVPLNVYNTSKN